MKLMIQPDAGVVPVVEAIRRAKHSIDIAIFRLNLDPVEVALGAAVERGVKVRALVANTNAGGEPRLRKLEQRLLARGVTVSRTGDELLKYHGKYFIADNVLHLLGFNFTKADALRSRSFGIQTRDRRAVHDAGRLFECDLARQTFQGAARSSLVVSPETARDALTAFIKGARRHLAIYDLRLEDPRFVALLRQKIAAGVIVQVIGRAPRLEPVSQVRMLKDLRLHVRAIIRDGTRAFVGSQSLRSLELERRREVGLVITNPSVTRRMLEVFDQDWKAAAPAAETDAKTGKDVKDKKEKDKKEKKEKKEKTAKKEKDAKEVIAEIAPVEAALPKRHHAALRAVPALRRA